MHAFEPFAARSGEQEAHVDVIAKPEGKGDMPAVPEIADVPREERPVKVFRSVDAKQITNADGESAVSREIEEQIKAVGIHVTNQRREAIAMPSRPEPALFDQRSEDELVEQSREKSAARRRRDRPGTQRGFVFFSSRERNGDNDRSARRKSSERKTET